VKALSSEITIGTSAPPTGSTSSSPISRPRTPSAMPIHIAGPVTVSTPNTIAAMPDAAKTSGRPGKTTGREVISSCSLAKVTIEPAKETAPTRIVNAVAASVNHATSISHWTAGRSQNAGSVVNSWSSSSATSAAAPPPTPLKSATI
jgi:hypothetical protein